MIQGKIILGAVQTSEKKEVIVIAGKGAPSAAADCQDYLWRAGYNVFMIPDFHASSSAGGSANSDHGASAGDGSRQRIADQEAAFLVDILNREGGLHALINFSKGVLAGAAEDTTGHEMRRCFEGDYFALAQRIRMVMPTMRLQEAGVIINVCESAGVGVGAFFCHHRAAQAAIKAFSSALYEEVRPFGIEVSFIEASSAVSEAALTQARRARLSRLYWNWYKQAVKEARDAARSAPRALAMQIERIVARAAVAKRLEETQKLPTGPSGSKPHAESQRASGFVVKQMVPARANKKNARCVTKASSVDFEGNWNPADRRRVEYAISESDTLCLLGSPRSYENAWSWHCTAESLPDGRRFYAANRSGLGRVLTADTADELARRISSARQSLASYW